MTLKNWRSFHGENSIEFSVDPDQPITLILWTEWRWQDSAT